MLKGIKGVHHVAISVPDLKKAEEFYCGILGFGVVDRYDFDASPKGDKVLALQGAAARSLMISAGNVYLEVFEFSNPKAAPQPGMRPVCDHGYTHIALDVDDVWSVYEALEKAGVKWHSPPNEDSDGGQTITMTYGRDPFGNVIEIQQLEGECQFKL